MTRDLSRLCTVSVLKATGTIRLHLLLATAILLSLHNLSKWWWLAGQVGCVIHDTSCIGQRCAELRRIAVFASHVTSLLKCELPLPPLFLTFAPSAPDIADPPLLHMFRAGCVREQGVVMHLRQRRRSGAMPWRRWMQRWRSSVGCWSATALPRAQRRSCWAYWPPAPSLLP